MSKAKTVEELDPDSMAKMLADIAGINKDVRTISMMAVKMSTFAILRVEGADDDAKPVAFTITPQQRTTLLQEAQELAKKKDTKDTDYVDICAELLVTTLRKELPFYSQ